MIGAAHQQITQERWNNRREDFEIYVSEFVINEASAGDLAAAEKRLSVLENMTLLDVNLEVESFGEKVDRRQSMGVKSRNGRTPYRRRFGSRHRLFVKLELQTYC